MSVRPDDVRQLKSGDEALLELIGDEIAALGIRADLQSVLHLGSEPVLVPRHVPERVFVLVRSSAGPGLSLRGLFGLLRNRSGNGKRELRVHCLKTLHAGDLVAESGDLVLHTGVGGVVLSGEYAVVIAVRLEEGPRGRKLLRALLAQFVDSHTFILLILVFE